MKCNACTKVEKKRKEMHIFVLFLINHHFINKRKKINSMGLNAPAERIYWECNQSLGVAINTNRSSNNSNHCRSFYSVSIKTKRSNLHKNQFYETIYRHTIPSVFDASFFCGCVIWHQ